MTGTAAFFDLDRTLIRGSATFPLAVAAFRAGYVPPRDLLWDAVAAVSFVLRGATDEGSAALRERILRVVAGHPAADFTALSEVFVPKLVASVLPEARELLAEHGSAGHDRFVVSASPVEIVRPLAEQLGLEGAVGTRSTTTVFSQARWPGRSAIRRAKPTRSACSPQSAATTWPTAMPTATRSATCRSWKQSVSRSRSIPTGSCARRPTDPAGRSLRSPRRSGTPSSGFRDDCSLWRGSVEAVGFERRSDLPALGHHIQPVLRKIAFRVP